jgi:hypothetical protein
MYSHKHVLMHTRISSCKSIFSFSFDFHIIWIFPHLFQISLGGAVCHVLTYLVVIYGSFYSGQRVCIPQSPLICGYFPKPIRYLFPWTVIGCLRNHSPFSFCYVLLSPSASFHREYGRRDPSRWPRGTLYSQKLAITLPTSGGRSVGIVCSRTQIMEFFFSAGFL